MENSFCLDLNQMFSCFLPVFVVSTCNWCTFLNRLSVWNVIWTKINLFFEISLVSNKKTFKGNHITKVRNSLIFHIDPLGNIHCLYYPVHLSVAAKFYFHTYFILLQYNLSFLHLSEEQLEIAHLVISINFNMRLNFVREKK